jgi:hypothetical protein
MGKRKLNNKYYKKEDSDQEQDGGETFFSVNESVLMLQKVSRNFKDEILTQHIYFFFSLFDKFKILIMIIS